jgi:hypothetical protein
MKIMKQLVIGLALMSSVAGSAAWAVGHGHSGGGGHFSGGGHFNGHGHGHVGVGVFLGVPLLGTGYYPYNYPYYYPSYPGYYPYYPYGYGAYYPYGAAPMSADPPVYVERGQESQAGGSLPANYWYYCSNPQGYYPYVKECPNGWQPVAPQPPSPQ